MKLLCIELLGIKSALIPSSVSQYRYIKYSINFLWPRNVSKMKELAKYCDEGQFESAAANSEKHWNGIFTTFCVVK